MASLGGRAGVGDGQGRSAEHLEATAGRYEYESTQQPSAKGLEHILAAHICERTGRANLANHMDTSTAWTGTQQPNETLLRHLAGQKGNRVSHMTAHNSGENEMDHTIAKPSQKPTSRIINTHDYQQACQGERR